MDLREKLSSLDVPPKKVLKIVLGLSVVLLLMWLFTLSQVDYNDKASAQQYIAQQQSADTVAVEQTGGQLSATQPQHRYEESSSLFSNGLITFLVLLGILIGVWFWVDRKDSGDTQQVKREIDSQVLGEGAQMKIVEVNNEVWVLGVTANTVNLLHRYGQDEWTEEMPEPAVNGKDMFAKLFKKNL